MQRRLQLAQPWLRSRNAGFHGSGLDTPCAAPKAVASSSSRCLVPLARRFRSQRRRPSTSALRKFTHSSGDVCTMTSAVASPRGRVQRAPSSRRRRRLHRDDARGACRQRPRPHASRALVERGLRKAGCPLVGSVGSGHEARSLEGNDSSGSRGLGDERPLGIEQFRLEKRHVVISVNDPPLADQSSRSNRSQDIDLRRPSCTIARFFRNCQHRCPVVTRLNARALPGQGMKARLPP